MKRYLHKLTFLFILTLLFIFNSTKGQEKNTSYLEEIAGDSIDWVDMESLDYEDFKEITGIDSPHGDECEEPTVDVNIGFYQRLFDVRTNFDSELNCKRCQTDALFDILYEALDKGVSMGSLQRKIANQDFLKMVASEDGRLFSIQWNQGGANHSYYILVHQVVDGVYHVQNRRLYYDDDFSNRANSCKVDKIERLKNTGRYVISFSDSEREVVRLFGVNLLDNVLKKEYMFGNGKSFFEISFPKSFAERNNLINLEGLQLIYPIFEADGNVCDGFLFYNGFCFTDIETYNRELSDIELKGFKKTGRKYRLLSVSSDWVDEPYSKTGVDFVIDRYTNFKDDSQGIVQYSLCKTDLCPLLDADAVPEVDSLCLYLPLFEGRLLVDGLTPMILEEQLLSHLALDKKKSSPQPIYTAGYDEAYPYQKVRYTAMLFDRKPEVRDIERMSWAIEIDGKLEYLDKAKYSGMQIYLEMNPKWEGKVIKVIPYIGKPDTHFFSETQIVSRL